MINLVDTFSEFKAGKNIDRPTLMKVMEDVFRTLIKKNMVLTKTSRCHRQYSKGDLELWHKRLIVPDGEVSDPNKEISLSQAREIDPDYDISEECYTKLELEDFGRRSITAARQTLISASLNWKKTKYSKVF